MPQFPRFKRNVRAREHGEAAVARGDLLSDHLRRDHEHAGVDEDQYKKYEQLSLSAEAEEGTLPVERRKLKVNFGEFSDGPGSVKLRWEIHLSAMERGICIAALVYAPPHT